MIPPESSVRVRPLRSFYLYGSLFFISIIGSGFYAYGIHELMDKTVSKSDTRDSFSFGDLITIVVGIVLVTSTYADIGRQMAKLRRFSATLNACESLFAATTTKVVQNNLYSKEIRSNSISPAELMLDLIRVQVSIPIFFFIECYHTSTTNNADVIMLAKTCTLPSFRTAKSGTLSAFMAAETNACTPSASMLRLVEIKMLALKERGCFITDVIPAMSEPIANVRERIHEYNSAKESPLFSILSIGNSVIAILYFILTPFLLWFSQGWKMLATFPVLYLIVGGIVSFKWFISDPILYPTYILTRPIYDRYRLFFYQAENFCDNLGLSQFDSRASLKTLLSDIGLDKI